MQLRALIASGRKPGILVALDFALTEVDVGRAVFAGVPGEHAYNPIGTVHGGYAATLLDSPLRSPGVWVAEIGIAQRAPARTKAAQTTCRGTRRS
jgi:hypothetical protein